MSLWICVDHGLTGPTACCDRAQRTELQALGVNHGDTICDRCNQPEYAHSGVEKFCPLVSTFRAPSTGETE